MTKLFVQIMFLLAVVVGADEVADGGADKPYIEVMHAKQLRVRASSALRARNIALYAANCAALVDDFLRCPSQPEGMLQISERGLSEQQDRARQVEFLPDERMDAVTWRLMQAMLSRRAREMKYQVADDAPVLRWLASALTNRMIMGGRGVRGIYELDYQVANQQFVHRHFPRVDELVMSALSPEYTDLFQLHMLHCDLLVGCYELLPAARGQVIRELLELSAKGRPLVESLRDVLQSYQPGMLSLQAWYERQVLIVCHRGIRHQSLDMIVDCVDILETVRMVHAGNGLEMVRRVRLDEVPDAIKDLKLDRAAVGQLQLRFHEVRKDAPVLLQPALDRYIAALGTLAAGQTGRFRQEFKDACGEFARAVAQQRRIAAVLDSAEREYVSVPDRFGAYLRVQERYDDLAAKLLPTWQGTGRAAAKTAPASTP